MAKELKPFQPVHEPQQEVNPENGIQLEPNKSDKYTGASHGAKLGSSSGAKAAGVIGIVKLFFYILQLALSNTFLSDQANIHMMSVLSQRTG
jgi:hypothetical protein